MNLEKLAQVNSVVLLEGETGTGKSYFARKIYEKSSVWKKAFVQVNAAAISKNLFESELFGHKKGAFTGASCDKEGFCDRAQGGTLFIDEVGELSADLQSKLLLLLEEKIYYPVGCSYKRHFSGKIICATNKSLKQLVEEGFFRKDLYYRLNVFTKELLPLAKRADKGHIIQHFFEVEKRRHKKRNINMNQVVRGYLNGYSWPGNIRELKNLCEYLVFMHDGEVTMESLPSWIEKTETSRQAEYFSMEQSYHQAKEIFEKNYLATALKRNKGMINRTSRDLQLNKVTLLAKIKKYDINVSQLAS